jgi:hypothetical protein
MSTEIDASQVLTSNSALLMQRKEGIVRDIADLPYPKDVIKAVLLHCIRLAAPGNDRQLLRNGYLYLADYQVLTNEERNALKGWDGAIQQHDPGQMTQQQLLGVANTLSDTGKLIALVNKRVVAEMETLADGLKAADL